MQSNQSNQKNILLVGSGMMAESLVDYLLLRPENHVVIASNILKDAEAIASKKQRCKPCFVEVEKESSLGPLVQDADIVISFIPAFLHIHVAKVCLKMQKNMVTSSYISPELRALDDDVKKANLTFINEIGLDPGIDHLATMKIIDEVKAQGGKIVEYESWCGGLPSPEFCDNPIGYKFSWSPIGALNALNNNSKFISQGQVVEIPNTDLMYSSTTQDVNLALRLEGYPNRDSCQYKELYGLVDAHRVIRGTLRYSGFCEVMGALKQIGLFSQDPVTQSVSWFDFVSDLIKMFDGKQVKGIQQQNLEKLLNQIGRIQLNELLVKILNVVLQHKFYQGKSEEEILQRASYFLKAIVWMGVLESGTMIKGSGTRIENLCQLLEKKLELKKGETDMVAMQHVFKIVHGNGKIEVKKSSLVRIGEKKGNSAMSILVGTPAGVACQLILDGVIKETGVIFPNKKSIYEPITQKLEEFGIRLIESSEFFDN